MNRAIAAKYRRDEMLPRRSISIHPGDIVW